MLAVDASDGELARMVAGRTAGEAEEAEAELYRRFAFRIRLYGLRHLGDEDRALDLVQQVMLVTIEKLRQGAVRDGNQIGSFILGTSRTMAIDLKRKERRRERLREAFRPHATVAAEPDAALDLDRVESCLAQLGERDRAVLFLAFYAECAAAAIAGEIGISEGNVRVVRHRALARLRACVMASRLTA
jgi:RNA polymerase sigma-70 factor (ECF subfamily)